MDKIRRIVEKLVNIDGTVSYEEINEAMGEENLSPDELEKVIEELQAMGIKIVEEKERKKKKRGPKSKLSELLDKIEELDKDEFTYEELGEIVGKEGLMQDELEEFMDELDKRGIKVISSEERKKRHKGARYEDSVGLYLNEVQNLKLQSREQEQEAARKIEEGYREITKAIFGTLLAPRELLKYKEKIEKDKLNVEHFIRLGIAKPTHAHLNKEKKRILKILSQIEQKYNEIEKMRENNCHAKDYKRKKKRIKNLVIALDLQFKYLDEIVKKLRDAYAKMMEYVDKIKITEDKEEIEHLKNELRKIEWDVGMRHWNLKKVLEDVDKWQKIIEKGKQEIVEANVRLVIATAKKFVNRGLDLSDLIQEGNCGLMKAIQRFNYKKGYKFGTYATWWVRQQIMKAISEHSRVYRIPPHMSNLMSKVQRARKELQQLGREPTLTEIARKTGLPVKKVKEVFRMEQGPISLDKQIGTRSDGTPIGDLVPDTDKKTSPSKDIHLKIIREKLEMALRDLPRKEYEILTIRYGLVDGVPKTLEEVGDMFNLTRERIRQIEKKALKRLRCKEKSEILKPLLDLLE